MPGAIQFPANSSLRECMHAWLGTHSTACAEAFAGLPLDSSAPPAPVPGFGTLSPLGCLLLSLVMADSVRLANPRVPSATPGEVDRLLAQRVLDPNDRRLAAVLAVRWRQRSEDQAGLSKAVCKDLLAASFRLAAAAGSPYDQATHDLALDALPAMVELTHAMANPARTGRSVDFDYDWIVRTIASCGWTKSRRHALAVLRNAWQQPQPSPALDDPGAAIAILRGLFDLRAPASQGWATTREQKGPLARLVHASRHGAMDAASIMRLWFAAGSRLPYAAQKTLSVWEAGLTTAWTSHDWRLADGVLAGRRARALRGDGLPSFLAEASSRWEAALAAARADLALASTPASTPTRPRSRA